MTQHKKLSLFFRLFFCGPFVLGGILAGYFGVWQSWLDYRAMQSWTEVPAIILQSELVSDGSGEDEMYHVEVEYEYEFQDQKYRGSRINILETTGRDFKKYDRLNRKLAGYVESGEPYACFVNPATPAESVLNREMDWNGFYMLIAISILFPIAGIGGFWFMGQLDLKQDVFGPQLFLIQQIPLFVKYVFSGMFVLFGLIIGVFVGIVPLWEYNAMKSWEEVPAVIESSELITHQEENGDDKYSIKVLYEYEYEGRKYRGDRATIFGGADIFYEKHDQRNRELNEHVKSGEPYRCFVDPGSPSNSILYRTMFWKAFYLALVMSIVFIGIGVGLYLLMGWWIRRKEMPVISVVEENAERLSKRD